MNMKNAEKTKQRMKKQERKHIRVRTDVKAGEYGMGEYGIATQRIQLPDGRIVLKMS